MFTQSLAAASAISVTNLAQSAELGAKLAEAGEGFAALLGQQVVVAAAEPASAAPAPRPVLPIGGKALPGIAEAEPEPVEAAPRGPSDSAEPAPPLRVLFDPPPLLSATIALVVPTPIPSFAVPVDAASQPVAAYANTARPQPHGAEPDPLTEARSPVAPTDGEPPVKTAPVSKGEATDKPGRTRPETAPPISLPEQAADRAVLVLSSKTTPATGPAKLHPVVPAQAADRAVLVLSLKPAPATAPAPLPPVLPEQAAAQATVALTARGNPRHPGGSGPTNPIAVTPSAADPKTPMPLNAVEDVLAERAPLVDNRPALLTAAPVAAPESGSSITPQTAPPAPSAPSAPARHDFAALVDRLIEARDLAGGQPIAMTLRHDDFGAVSLDFRTSGDGLSVTMASPDPEFARAVGAAATSAAANNPSDTPRHGGEPAASSSRQPGGSSAGDDLSGHSRGGSRADERDPPRQRRDQPSPQATAHRQTSRNGVFA